MKARFLALATLCLVSSLGGTAALAAPRGWKSYSGPWFKAYAPSGWKATPKKRLAAEDSAVFTSPDGRARFSVFSPIWNGAPPDIVRGPQETLVAKRSSITKGIHTSTIRTQWMTFKSSDGRWLRSVVDRENITLNTRLTFGFAYRDQKTYKRYQPAFETFKKSLIQYAD